VLPSRPLSDERLAALVHRGDDAAFETLYERYSEPLSRYCRSIVHHSEDASDAQQNTMVAALRALRARPLEGRVKPWLYRIAHNESVTVLRRRRGHEQLDENTPSLDATADRLENWEALLADLRSLPERQRGALLLRELTGLDYDEIAYVFSITAVAARKSVFEARAGLAETLAGRNAACEEIRVRISDGDRRVLRGRRVSGHLASCAPCASFALSIRSRREVFGMVPAFPATAGLAGGLGGAAIGGGALTVTAIKGVALCALCAIAGSVVLNHAQHAAALHARRHPVTPSARIDRVSAAGSHPVPGRSRGVTRVRAHTRDSAHAVLVSGRAPHVVDRAAQPATTAPQDGSSSRAPGHGSSGSPSAGARGPRNPGGTPSASPSAGSAGSGGPGAASTPVTQTGASTPTPEPGATSPTPTTSGSSSPLAATGLHSLLQILDHATTLSTRALSAAQSELQAVLAAGSLTAAQSAEVESVLAELSPASQSPMTASPPATTNPLTTLLDNLLGGHG
jgi:RNA polymerase sigma factor (sigma-70 family)